MYIIKVEQDKSEHFSIHNDKLDACDLRNNLWEYLTVSKGDLESGNKELVEDREHATSQLVYLNEISVNFWLIFMQMEYADVSSDEYCNSVI